MWTGRTIGCRHADRGNLARPPAPNVGLPQRVADRGPLDRPPTRRRTAMPGRHPGGSGGFLRTADTVDSGGRRIPFPDRPRGPFWIGDQSSPGGHHPLARWSDDLGPSSCARPMAVGFPASCPSPPTCLFVLKNIDSFDSKRRCRRQEPDKIARVKIEHQTRSSRSSEIPTVTSVP